uniref:Uncharacterized protein n=1 Tax=Amphimedon queenslandica TaxID=400682 RepID=A0A1X7U7E1_AMPQE
MRDQKSPKLPLDLTVIMYLPVCWLKQWIQS